MLPAGASVRVPVVTGGTSVADENGKASVVEVKTANGANGELGRYTYDNLPTAVVKFNTETGTDEYFLAAYRVELKWAHNEADGTVTPEPWHLTSLRAGTSRDNDSDADATTTGLASADGKNYPVANGFGTAKDARYNSGQVILAQAFASVDKDTQNPLAKKLVPALNAMDDAAAVEYQWTAPTEQEQAGDVGLIAPAHRTIAGYVWKDNDYHDGVYTYKLSATAADPGYRDPEDPTGNTKLKLTAPEGGRVGTHMFLRQWYFDPDKFNADTNSNWWPVKAYGTDVADEEAFSFATTRTQAADTAKGTLDGYYEFTDLPVSVYVDGAEYLAGYTVAIKGNPGFKPSDREVTTTFDPYITTDPAFNKPPDPVTNGFDNWNSKGHAYVKVGSNAVLENRYGANTFPLTRDDAYSSDGNIHTLDSILVLAGSTTADKTGASVATTQYAVTAAGKNDAADASDTKVSFDLTYGKNEGRINGGYVIPPSAPVEGYIWNDANYDGKRGKDEEGIAGVTVRISQYYLDPKTGRWVRTPNVWPDVKTADANDENGLKKGQYLFEDMPASYQPDINDTTEYLAGYRIEVVGLPSGATLTRPHYSDTYYHNDPDKFYEDGYNDDSDIYRGSSGRFPLANRFAEVKDADAASGKTTVRADGMVIIARPRTNDKNDPYPYDGVTYDIKTVVQRQQGGDAGLIYIPSTTIEGVVWDDSYQPVEGDPIADAAARARSYNGVRDAGEPGLSGRTMKLTQWVYDAATSRWTKVAAFGGAGERTQLTDDGLTQARDEHGDPITTPGGDPVYTTDVNGNVIVDQTRLGRYRFGGIPTALCVSSTDISAYAMAPLYETVDGTASVETLSSDSYRLASYQLEIMGLESGNDDGTWMLTGYHQGAITTDSDVEFSDRNGVGGGMVVSDSTTVAGFDGTRNGARSGTDANAVKTGARIVVAREGSQEEGKKTQIADPADYIGVPTTQLVEAEGATGEARYDWLTLAGSSVRGGDVGAVTPNRQSISGILWEDKDNDGIQDANELGMNDRAVDLERYYYDGNADGGAGAWVLDSGFTYTETYDAGGTPATRTGTVTHAEAINPATGLTGQPLTITGCGITRKDGFYWQNGQYIFKNLESVGKVDGQWVVYGYKVKVRDTSGLFKAKARVEETVTVDGAETTRPVDYKLNSDLYTDNYLTSSADTAVNPDNPALDEYIVLLEVVDNDGYTPEYATENPDGTKDVQIAARKSSASNIIYAPASNNHDQTNAANARTKGDLVAYDLMMSHDRAHSDGGLIIPPTYAISGFVWEDADYDGIYNYTTEKRVDGDKNIVDYVEHGYDNKTVVLKKWYYEPGAAGAAGTWVANGTAEVKTGDTTVATAEGNRSVSGYFLFDKLPTAVNVGGTWKLAGYTLEVKGLNATDGMASLLATTHQWQTTDSDAWNSKAQPMVTAPEAAQAGYAYSRGNYPVLWQETDVQTGEEPHVADGSKDGVSKNVLGGKIVLAGIGDAKSVAGQHVPVSVAQQDADALAMDFDFARGQDQTSMNAGFAPPDHSNLVGVVWFDENYDGIRDNINDKVDGIDGPAGDISGSYEESGLKDFTVVLTQYYFVPKYDEFGHQLLEDEDGNIFWKESLAGGETKLHLSRASSKVSNVIVGSNGQVYYVRNGRLYRYEETSRMDNLKDSGTWVENEAFTGLGDYLVEDAEGKKTTIEPDAATQRVEVVDGVEKLVVTAAGGSETSYTILAKPHERTTLTDDQGTYDFGDLPAYLLVDDEEKSVIKPNFKNVYQPQVVLTKKSIETLHAREVTVSMLQSLGLAEMENLSQAQLDKINEPERTEHKIQKTELVQKVVDGEPVWEQEQVDDGSGNLVWQDKLQQATDPDTGELLWEIEPVYDENDELVTPGTPKMEKIPVMEEQPVFDAEGKPVMVTEMRPVLDENDQPVLDENDQPVMEPVYDESESELHRVYVERLAQLQADAARTFKTATPYLAGYAIKVLGGTDENGQAYLASRFHVDSKGTDKDSDLKSFDANMAGKYNEDGEDYENYAVVAQPTKKDVGANERYEVQYKGVTYDLANRLFLKHAGDAGLILQDPVYIAGRVWDDHSGDGLQDEDEEGIQNATVKLVRYWFDATGAGMFEEQPGLSDPVTSENSSLTKEQIEAIASMVDESITTDWFATATLDMLRVMREHHGDYIFGYQELVTDANGNPTYDEDGNVNVISWPGNKELEDAYYARRAELEAATKPSDSDKGVWRRDWSFTQDEVAVLKESVDGEPVEGSKSFTIDELLAMTKDEPIAESNGEVYIPGAAFDATVSTGDWAFLVGGTGYHKIRTADGIEDQFKVLYGYRVEVVKYPNEDAYMPTLQHIGDDDTINSDFDEATGALRPNVGDVALPSKLDSVGDLIVLSQLADDTEGSATAGPYETYANVNDRRPEVSEEPEDTENPENPKDTEGGNGGESGETSAVSVAPTFATSMMSEVAALAAGEATEGSDGADKPLTDAEKEILAWIEQATLEELEGLKESNYDRYVAIFGAPTGTYEKDEYGNDDLSKPIYKVPANKRLMEAYEARAEELGKLTGTNNWSDLNWYNSLNHDFGLVKIAKADIRGIVWQDDGYDGNRDDSDTGRFEGVPVSLERYWYDGSQWVLDSTFPGATASSNGDGLWEFTDLDVAGKRTIDGKQRVVLYGFRVKVEDLPHGYGVTLLNQGAADETDSDLDEMTKILATDRPIDGMIVLANTSSRSDLASGGLTVYLAGPANTFWLASEGVDSENNDTGLVPYTTATIAGVAFNDPEADGLKDSTFEPVPGQKVYLERKVLDGSQAVGFSGSSYAPEALKAVSGRTVKASDGWTEVASMDTDVNGAYRFEGLPMVDDNDTPYVYRVRSTMPEGGEFVDINVGNDDNNDSDWGEATGSVPGTGQVGITPAMAVLGNFTAVRTEPNAYGQKFNLLTAYDWTPEVNRSVDLGMTGVENGGWKTLVFETPWGTKVFYVKLPQTGDELMPWMFALALLGAGALLLAFLARRKEEEDEEEEAI